MPMGMSHLRADIRHSGTCQINLYKLIKMAHGNGGMGTNTYGGTGATRVLRTKFRTHGATGVAPQSGANQVLNLVLDSTTCS